LADVPSLGLLGIAFVGTFFWPLSPEAAAALGAARYGWHPALVGLVGAAGQGAAHVLLFAFGDQIRRRWGWFDRQCQKVRLRFGARLTGSTPFLAVTSGLLGLPPTSATAALAPGLGLGPWLLLPLMFVARFIRFAVVAVLAQRL
jgi:membrane protein YqaA with SNARE-associated domain